MRSGPASKGPRLWLQPGRERNGRVEQPVWVIRDGPHKRSTGCGKAEIAQAERKLADYIAEKYKPARGKADASQVPIADVLGLYAEDVVPSHARPQDATAHLARLLSWWADPTAAMEDAEARGGRPIEMTGMIADIRTATCQAYMRYVGASRSGQKELEMLRAAINHAFREQMIDRPVAVWLPEKSAPRDRWLTRSEAAQLLWLAWRQSRGDQHGSRWPLIDEALALRAAGQSSAQIAETLGTSRNKVAGHLWRHDQRANSDEGDDSAMRVSRHVARFILVAFYTGKRKSAILEGAFSRKPGYGYIDLDNGIWHPPSGKRQTKKRQPAQPLPSQLIAHMRRWKKNGQEFAVEFRDEPIERLDLSFRAIVKTCGFKDVVIHTLRHTAITWGLQNGMDLWDASGYFGVSVEVLDRVYGHHSPHHLRQAAAIMGRRSKPGP